MIIPSNGFFRVSCNKDASKTGFTRNNGAGGKLRIEDYINGKDRQFPRSLTVDVWDDIIIEKSDGTTSNDLSLLEKLKVGDQIYAEIEADLRFKMDGILNSKDNVMESGYATKTLKLLYLKPLKSGKPEECSAWREAHKPKPSSGYSPRPTQRPPARPAPRQELATQSFQESEDCPF